LTMIRTQRTVSLGTNSGIALLTVILFIAMVGMFIAGLSTRLMIDKRQVDAFKDRVVALHAAEYAAQTAIDKFARDGVAGIGLDLAQIKVSSASQIATSLPDFDASGVSPIESPDTKGTKYYALVVSWGNDGRDNDGNGSVDGPEEQGIACVYGVAKAGKSVRAVEIAYRKGTEQNTSSAAFQRISWREIPPSGKGT
jgi:hypothetical protein